MRHKHFDLICRWAADTSQQVSWRLPGNTKWMPMRGAPDWNEGVEYHLAPAIPKYRVARCASPLKQWVQAVSTPESAAGLECNESFVEWLTPWTDMQPAEEPRTVTKEVWLNLYPDGAVYMYATKKDADRIAKPDRAECQRITWEVPA